MKQFTIYDVTGKIKRRGFCGDSSFDSLSPTDGFVIEGFGNDSTQKVEFDGLDESGNNYGQS